MEGLMNMKTVKKEIANLEKQIEALKIKANRANNKKVLDLTCANYIKNPYIKTIDTSEPGYKSITFSAISNVKVKEESDKFILTYIEKVIYITVYDRIIGNVSINEETREKNYYNNEQYSYDKNHKQWGESKNIKEQEFNAIWNEYKDAFQKCSEIKL